MSVEGNRKGPLLLHTEIRVWIVSLETHTHTHLLALPIELT